MNKRENLIFKNFLIGLFYRDETLLAERLLYGPGGGKSNLKPIYYPEANRARLCSGKTLQAATDWRLGSRLLSRFASRRESRAFRTTSASCGGRYGLGRNAALSWPKSLPISSEL